MYLVFPLCMGLVLSLSIYIYIYIYLFSSFPLVVCISFAIDVFLDLRIYVCVDIFS